MAAIGGDAVGEAVRDALDNRPSIARPTAPAIKPCEFGREAFGQVLAITGARRVPFSSSGEPSLQCGNPLFELISAAVASIRCSAKGRGTHAGAPGQPAKACKPGKSGPVIYTAPAA